MDTLHEIDEGDHRILNVCLAGRDCKQNVSKQDVMPQLVSRKLTYTSMKKLRDEGRDAGPSLKPDHITCGKKVEEWAQVRQSKCVRLEISLYR